MTLWDASGSTYLIRLMGLIWSYEMQVGQQIWLGLWAWYGPTKRKWVNRPDWAYEHDIVRRQPLAKITLLTDCKKTPHAGERPRMRKIALLKDCEKTPHVGGRPLMGKIALLKDYEKTMHGEDHLLLFEKSIWMKDHALWKISGAKDL